MQHVALSPGSWRIGLPIVVASGCALCLSLAGTCVAQSLSTEDIVQQLMSSPATKSLMVTKRDPTSVEKTVPDPDPADPTKAVADLRKEAGNLGSVSVQVGFDYDSDRLTPDAQDTLNVLIPALRDKRLQQFSFIVGGFTDARGSDAYNDALSFRRARAVRDYLSAKGGINPDRLVAMGYGERILADPRDPESAANRRVEIINQY